jgi:hypothetical protein
MDAYIFHFNANDLRKIESRALGFLISSGHCCNELVALMPYIVFEQSLKSANEVEAALIIARRYTVDRIIVSKIVEYDELCGKFSRETLSVGRRSIRRIKKRIRSDKCNDQSSEMGSPFRNKTSFHYDEKYATDSLRKLDDNHPHPNDCRAYVGYNFV